MAEHHFRAQEIGGGGLIRQTGDAVIVAPLGESDELQFCFPAYEIPNLMLLLARIHAQHVSGRDVAGSLGQMLGVDSALVLPVKGLEEIGLILDLSTGTPASFAFPRLVAEDLRDQLSVALA